MLAFVSVTLIISRYVWTSNTKLIIAFSFMSIALFFQIINLICETFKCLRIQIAPIFVMFAIIIITIVFHGISVITPLITLIMLLIVIIKQENPETLCGPFKYSEVLITATCYTFGSILLAGILILIIFFCQPPIEITSSLERKIKELNNSIRNKTNVNVKI
ncbi:unnamed protein product [Brugia pahangi]|uniref:Transmembrane domain-containing protein n=1 Tax=Brugia pahangi TaxID=6280 RepID=A0A0N4TAG3_BRUPA|nr:unnamed protein product [Brugia pahangi]